MKKVYIIVFCLLITSMVVYTQNSIEDLYNQVLEYYDLAQEEHEKGDYIKSYEYSQLANGLFGNASMDIYVQLASLMLDDLQKSISEAIENMDESDTDYRSIVNAYNAGKEQHDKFNSYTLADDQTLIQSTFEDARDYYQAAAAMIDKNSNSSQTSEPARVTTDDTKASQTSIDEANTKYAYLTKNNILTTSDSSYKSLSSNVDKMNKEQSQSLADENIKAMNVLIIENDIKKMFDYSDKGVARASHMGSKVLDSDGYKNITTQIETARSQYANGELQAAASNIAQALVAMESDFSILSKLPATYTVVKNSNPNLTDSFWRISGYDFIYADREKWPTLYEANLNKVRYEGNPRIINPGVVFNIKSIFDEPREGRYNPTLIYVPVTAYYYLNGSDSVAASQNEASNMEESVVDSNDDTTNTSVGSDNNTTIDDDNTNTVTDDTNASDGVTNVLNKDDLGEDTQISSGITVDSYN